MHKPHKPKPPPEIWAKRPLVLVTLQFNRPPNTFRLKLCRGLHVDGAAPTLAPALAPDPDPEEQEPHRIRKTPDPDEQEPHRIRKNPDPEEQEPHRIRKTPDPEESVCKCSPYASIHLADRKRTSQVEKRTPHPKWNQTFLFNYLTDINAKLEVEIMKAYKGG